MPQYTLQLLPMALLCWALSACATVTETGLTEARPALTPAPHLEVQAFDSPVQDLSVTPDGRWLAVAGHFGDIRLFNADSLALEREFDLTYAWDHTVRILLTDQHLFAASTTGAVRGWDLASGARLFSTNLRGYAGQAIAISFDERALIVPTQRGEIALDASSGARLSTPPIERRREANAYRVEGWYQETNYLFRADCTQAILLLPPWRHGEWTVTSGRENRLYLADRSGRVMTWPAATLPCRDD